MFCTRQIFTHIHSVCSFTSKYQITLLVLMLFYSINISAEQTLHYQELQTPDGTATLKLADNLQVDFLLSLNSARLFVFGPEREILIGTKTSRIYRIAFPYKRAELLADIPDSSAVHSLALRNNELFAADSCAIYRAIYQPDKKPDFKLFIKLPCQSAGHYTRTVINGPDNQLYVSLGISGNCSDEFLGYKYPFEKRRGGIYRIAEPTNGNPALIPYAAGLRNPIGMAFSKDNVLFATNAGADNLGYELPPEILARTHEGSFHGMPWYQYYDGEFHSGKCTKKPSPVNIKNADKPAALFAARSTPIGIDFLTGQALDGNYADSAIVAIHGSWGKPAGGGPASRREPKITQVIFSPDGKTKIRDLINGFQRNDGSRLARPAGIKQGPDGHIYFSSDGGDAQGLFRIRLTD